MIYNKSFVEWFKKTLFFSILVTAVSWVICIFFPVLFPVFGVDSSLYLQTYYDHENASNNVLNVPYDDLVVIVNTQEISGPSARGDIADIIDVVCKAGALVVGVDIRFPEREDSNNDKLRNTLLRHSEKVVMARAYHNNEIRGSFFDNDSLRFGITSLPSYYNYWPTVETENKGDLEIFSYAVANSAFPHKKWEFKKFVVNYESSDSRFYIIPADELLAEMDLTEVSRLIGGKIVLLGDLDDEKDYHDIPFKIDGRNECIGVKLHAYAIRSLCEQGVAFKRMNFWIDNVLCFFLSFVFAAFFTLAALLDKALKDKNRVILYNILLLLKPFILVLVYYALIRLCFYFFTEPETRHYIPNVIQFIISTLIINGKLSSFWSHQLMRSKK